MKINFDNMRRGMVRELNSLIQKYNAGNSNLSEEIEMLCCYIGGFLCIYDPDIENFSDLSDVLEIEELKTDI